MSKIWFLSCFLCITIFSVIGQEHPPSIFSKQEMDSINYIYYPLYSSDSICIANSDEITYFGFYLFNGDCSLCLGDLIKADDYFNKNKFDDVQSCFIVETHDTILFNFNRDRLKLKTSVLWDKNFITRERYDVTVSGNTLILIDNKGQLYYEGNIFACDKLMKSYLKIIKSF